MPEIWDLWLPYDGGKEFLCRMELLYRDHFPTFFSVYKRRFDYEEVKSGPKSKNSLKQNPAAEIHVWDGKSYLVQKVNSFAYNFEYNTGKLLYLARREGDFSKAEFRWSDRPLIKFEGPDIIANHIRSAKSIAKGAYNFLKNGEQEVTILKERERYGRFLSPLEKIIAR